MSEFKRGWYLNSKETQEKLFELGYRWRWGGDEVKFLTQNYVFTGEDGQLTYGNLIYDMLSAPKGTQLDKDTKKSNVDLFVDKLSELLKQPEKWDYLRGPSLNLKFTDYFIHLDDLDFGLELNDNQKVGLHELVLDLENKIIESENEKNAKILLDKISGVTNND